MIKLEHISKTYHETLFEDITVLFGNKEKIGLIGLNGCGKTTLLKIIAGIEKADSGHVEVVNEVIAYLPQEYQFDEYDLVGEFLEALVDDPFTQMYKVERILRILGIPDIDHYQDIHTLSPGQKMKLKLTELLMKEPTVLLLDEPTNHLDIHGILWFEDFVTRFNGITITISHDRAVLNNTTDLILEIDNRSLLIFEGNYDDYLIGKEQWLQECDKQYKAQERKRKKIEQLIENVRKIRNSKKRGNATRAAKTRLNREVTLNERNQYKERSIQKLTLFGEMHRKKKVVAVKSLSFGYMKSKNLFEDVEFSINGNDKIWFHGQNGIGKTTFIKLLTGQLVSQNGVISWGENIQWTYFSQNQSHLDMNATVAEFFMEQTKISFEKSFGTLERFLFPKELRNYAIKTLSPGQRARLSFAIFSCSSYNFLILDEPTNHLDIRTKEIIEEALSEFKGSMLIISHDRYFVQNIGINRVITIEHRNIVEKDMLHIETTTP